MPRKEESVLDVADNIPPVDSDWNEKVDWESLIEDLWEERCILCIGPGVFAQPNSHRLESELATYLKDKEEELRIRVYDDGWFHFLPGASEIDAYKRVKQFYSQPSPQTEELFQNIASIPFHFLLNFTPDYKLLEAFEQLQIPVAFESFEFNAPVLDDDFEAPSKERPLLFNMVGQIRKRNSLILTYNDFYGYLKSEFDGKVMAPKLRETIWEADYFIFLGMPFDKWYTHLFMRILQQHDRKRSSKKYAANNFLDDRIVTHCEEQYTITFVPTDIHNFIARLYVECETRGKLRKGPAEGAGQRPSVPHPDFNSYRNLISQNKLTEVFDGLQEVIPALGRRGEEWRNRLILLQRDFQDVKRKRHTASADEDQLRRRENEITLHLLDLLSEMERTLKNPPDHG